jgi:hypothetical protein
VSRKPIKIYTDSEISTLSEFLSDLSASMNQSTLPDLIRRHMGPLLKEYRTKSEEWGPASYEALVFAALLSESKWAAGYFAETLVAVFRHVLREDASPELKIKMLLVLARQLANVRETVDSQEQFGQFSRIVVTGTFVNKGHSFFGAYHTYFRSSDTSSEVAPWKEGSGRSHRGLFLLVVAAVLKVHRARPVATDLPRARPRHERTRRGRGGPRQKLYLQSHKEPYHSWNIYCFQTICK